MEELQLMNINQDITPNRNLFRVQLINFQKFLRELWHQKGTGQKKEDKLPHTGCSKIQNPCIQFNSHHPINECMPEAQKFKPEKSLRSTGIQ